MKEYANVLRENMIFSNFTEDEILLLFDVVSPRVVKYKKKDYIIRVGDTTREFACIVEGSVNVQKIDYEGNNHIIANFAKSSVILEAFAFSGASVVNIDIIAAEPCTLIYMKKEALLKLVQTDYKLGTYLGSNLLCSFSKRLLEVNKKMDILTKESIRDKVLTYLVTYFDISDNKIVEIPFNREELADFLCVNRSSLSRELSRMRDEGIIDFHKNSFKILN